MKLRFALAFAAGLVASFPLVAAADDARGWKIFDTVNEMTDEPEWLALVVPDEEIGDDGSFRFPMPSRMMGVECSDGVPRVIVQLAAMDTMMADAEKIQYRFDKKPAQEAIWQASGSLRGLERDEAWGFLNNLEGAEKLILKRGADTLHFTVAGAGPIVGKIRKLCGVAR